MKRITYILLLLFLTLTSCRANEPINQDDLPRIEVYLGKSLEYFRGAKWPKYDGEILFEFNLIQHPSELTIYFPSGRKLIFKVRNADFDQENAIIENIKIRLPIKPLEYQEAITNLESEYSKIANSKDSTFQSRIEEWKKAKLVPGWPDSKRTAFHFEKDIDIGLGVESVEYQGKQMWLYFFEFYLIKDTPCDRPC